jgi:hypothetical protein
MKIKYYQGSINSSEYWMVQDESFLNYSVNSAILDWCDEQFGHGLYRNKGPSRGDRIWTFGHKSFTFSCQDDLTLFLLRWGH